MHPQAAQSAIEPIQSPVHRTQARNQALDHIASRAPVLPVLVIDQLEDAIPLAQALVSAGLEVLEITLRTPAALDAIAAIAKALPDAIVGAGTVLSRAQLDAVQARGAKFAIAPGSTPKLLLDCQDSGIPLLPGVASASEVMAGIELGYERFKFFPAQAVGGVAALKNFAGPFAHLRFCPTGGIDASIAPSYLALSNVFTVGGSWMAPTAMIKARDWPGIHALAKQAAALRG